MKNQAHNALCFITAGLLLFLAPFSNGADEQSVKFPKVVKELKQGRALWEVIKTHHIILFTRHFARSGKDQGPANLAFENMKPENWKDCSWQSNLTDEGRQQAKETGRGIRRANWKGFDLISSPFCRTVESAKLLFEKDPQIDRGLAASGVLGYTDKQSTEYFISFLLEKHSKNQIVVGHSKYSEWLEPMNEGETLVLEVKPADEATREPTIRLLGKIAPAEWAASGDDPESLGAKAVKSGR